jgi:hypothetical protein
VAAQETGTIVGNIQDATTAQSLSGAQAFVNDGVVGALSDLNGRFVIARVPAGVVSVTVQLEEIFITATRERGSQAFILDERRTSGALVEGIGAAEIATRPARDGPGDRWLRSERVSARQRIPDS